MKVRQIHERDVVTISPEDSIVKAAKLMRQHHVGDVVIAGQGDDGPIPLGVITDRDLVVSVLAQEVENPDTIRVADIAGRVLHTATEDQELSEVIKEMWGHGVRRMPVVDASGSLLGIVTYDDIIRRLSDELAEATRMMPRQQRREAKTRT